MTVNSWQRARISRITQQSARTKSFVLDLPQPLTFMAGQHCEIRLTAPSGYQAAREYSISSAPSDGYIEITVIHAPHGEVSGWLIDTAEVGDELEVRGPIGKYFVWTPDMTEPILLLAGGVGVAPLLSIVREHRHAGSTSPLHLFYSARNYDNIVHKDELMISENNREKIVFTLVESIPGDWQGHSGLVTADMIEPLVLPGVSCYVCGPNGFVEAIDTILVDQLDIDPARIKTERFG